MSYTFMGWVSCNFELLSIVARCAGYEPLQNKFQKKCSEILVNVKSSWLA